MRKFIGTVVIILALIAGAGYLAYLNSAFLLSRVISEKTETSVTIGEVTFEKAAFSIKEILIGNPKKSRLPTAMKVETVRVEAPYRQYFKDPILIDAITLTNVYVNIQFYDKDQKTGNWQTILDNMKVDHDSPVSVERAALIRKLVLTNIQIDLILPDGKIHHLSPIPRLEFHEVSSDKGVPTQEISEIIVNKMMKSIFIERVLKAPFNIIKDVIPFL